MALPQRLTTFHLYLFTISLIGLCVLGLGIFHIPDYEPGLTFALLVALAVVAALAPMSAAVLADVGVNYGLGAAVSLAAFPSFGPAAAALLVAIYSFAFWLSRPADRKTWKKSGQQLIFNITMQAIAVYVAGWVFSAFRHWLGPTTQWGQILPWLPGTLVYLEVNIWLLIGVLRLQHGPTVQPLALWREERSTSAIIVPATAVGGGMLGYAVEHYDLMGVLVFFWPILLSAYAFRLYVQQMEAHLANLEQIVDERTKDLADLNQKKDAYLAILTHDMMTPLTSIQLCAEELQADPAAAIDNPDLITFLLRSQHTLFTMVRNILDIEKLQAGGLLSSKKVSCDLTQLLTNVVELLQNEAGEKNVSIQNRSDSRAIFIHADRQQMERILLNLLANAVKYTPQGGTVEVEAMQQDQNVVLHVRDTGYGIPAEDLAHIFDRFWRVAQHQEKATGSGLGLAITKALVEEHGGAIAVASTVGQGSTFTVKLPIGIKE
ncbi:MAG: HAMP domain-containing sensor histidine kinase [Caldilineaceae bacterium]